MCLSSVTSLIGRNHLPDGTIQNLTKILSGILGEWGWGGNPHFRRRYCTIRLDETIEMMQTFYRRVVVMSECVCVFMCLGSKDAVAEL